jgi:hypothetical protein
VVTRPLILFAMQLEKVEAELNRTKQSRERQARDWERQREDMLRVHAEQITELKIKLEMEKARQTEDLHAQSELLNAGKAKEMANLRDALQADIVDVERRARERMEKDAKVCLFFLDLESVAVRISGA